MPEDRGEMRAPSSPSKPPKKNPIAEEEERKYIDIIYDILKDLMSDATEKSLQYLVELLHYIAVLGLWEEVKRLSEKVEEHEVRISRLEEEVGLISYWKLETVEEAAKVLGVWKAVVSGGLVRSRTLEGLGETIASMLEEGIKATIVGPGVGKTVLAFRVTLILASRGILLVAPRRCPGGLGIGCRCCYFQSPQATT